MLTGIAACTPSASSTPRLAASQACLAAILRSGTSHSCAQPSMDRASSADRVNTPTSHPNALTWPHHSSDRPTKMFLSLFPAPKTLFAAFYIRSRATCSARAWNMDVKCFSLSLSLSLSRSLSIRRSYQCCTCQSLLFSSSQLCLTRQRLLSVETNVLRRSLCGKMILPRSAADVLLSRFSSGLALDP